MPIIFLSNKRQGVQEVSLLTSNTVGSVYVACLIVHLLGGLHAFLEEIIFQFIWQSKK